MLLKFSSMEWKCLTYGLKQWIWIILTAVPLIEHGHMLFACMGTRMTRQFSVPNCDGPILLLLLLHVSSCCAAMLSLKMPSSAGVAASRARLLWRCSIDPPAVAESPVVAIVGLSSTFLTYGGGFAWGHRSLLSHGCCLYGRIIYALCLTRVLDEVRSMLFNQDHQSIPTFTVWPSPC